MAYGYSALSNTFRLQKCLKVEAREEVKSLLIIPENVESVIEQVRFKYGQPEFLIKSQLQKVREMPYIFENQLDRIIAFSSKVQNLTIFLKTANAHQHLSNPTLLEELIAKLPVSKRMEWASYSMMIQPYPSLEDFCRWLQQLARVESMVAINSPLPKPSFVKHQQINQKFPSKKVISIADSEKSS